MKELITCLNDNVAIRLNKVVYNRIDTVDEENINFNIKDNFKASYEDNKTLDITVERKVSCIPENLMEISVEFEIQRYIDENSDVILEEFDLEKEITIDNINEYIDGNLNRASVLISNITIGFGMPPLVTPPVFISVE